MLILSQFPISIEFGSKRKLIIRVKCVLGDLSGKKIIFFFSPSPAFFFSTIIKNNLHRNKSPVFRPSVLPTLTLDMPQQGRRKKKNQSVLISTFIFLIGCLFPFQLVTKSVHFPGDDVNRKINHDSTSHIALFPGNYKYQLWMNFSLFGCSFKIKLLILICCVHFWEVLFLGQIFAIMPVTGISSKSANNLKFEWINFRTLYASVVMTGQAIMIILAARWAMTNPLSMSTIGICRYNHHHYHHYHHHRYRHHYHHHHQHIHICIVSLCGWFRIHYHLK